MVTIRLLNHLQLPVLVKSLSYQVHHGRNLLVRHLCMDRDLNSNEIIVEINPGVGGQEAMLFTRELFEIYLKYAKSQKWHITSIDDNFSDIGGLRSAALGIQGANCFRYFRHEAGVHRVQRVPFTERGGRIHTSTATVAVIPVQHRLSDIKLNPADLRFDYTTSSGPGGQHVNKKLTCVRVTHLPTKLSILSQETRSQEENKERAILRLKHQIIRQENSKLIQNSNSIRKNQVASADRSEKIRTYNFPQDRITDHRLKESISNLKEFIKGDSHRLHQTIMKLEERWKKMQSS